MSPSFLIKKNSVTHVSFHHHTGIISIVRIRDRPAQINANDASVTVMATCITKNFNEERRRH